MGNFTRDRQIYRLTSRYLKFICKDEINVLIDHPYPLLLLFRNRTRNEILTTQRGWNQSNWFGIPGARWMASSSSGQDGGDDPSNSSDDTSNINRPESPAPLLYVSILMYRQLMG